MSKAAIKADVLVTDLTSHLPAPVVLTVKVNGLPGRQLDIGLFLLEVKRSRAEFLGWPINIVGNAISHAPDAHQF